jgi:hypothetical protein
LTGTAECPEFCLHRSKLNPCPAKCECAYIREIIQAIKNWPKAGSTGSGYASVPEPR